MQRHDLEFTVVKPFGNLFRGRTVLVAVQTDDGKILLGAKEHFYPPTIVRLLGGGVDDGETFERAAKRELQEELGVVAPALTPLTLFNIRATAEDGKVYTHQTATFLARIGGAEYRAGDDVSHIVPMTLSGLDILADRYNSLHPTLWRVVDEGNYAWADYGKMYGPIHKIVAQHIKQLG